MEEYDRWKVFTSIVFSILWEDFEIPQEDKGQQASVSFKNSG